MMTLEGTIPNKLDVGFLQAPLTVLGPGRRVGLWLRGCDRRCPGCISDDLSEAGAEPRRPVKQVFEEIERLRRETKATGLTISEGEPFQQAETLKALLTLVRAAEWVDVLIYSGFLLKDLLAAHPWLPNLIAALVDGPYERGQPSQEPWRGSTNQKLTLFRPDLAERYGIWQDNEERKVQVVIAESNAIHILGIPAPGDFDDLKQKLKGLYRGPNQEMW